MTAAGKIFFEKASRAQDVFRSMEQCATELHDARIHRVRIAAAPLLGCTLIPLLAYRFMRRYPEMRVELVDLPMSRVQQAVVDGSEEDILILCRRTSAALAERNRLCKLNK